MPFVRSAVRFAALLVVLLAASGAHGADATPPPASRPAGEAGWVEAMRQVHAKFTGKPGTFAHFGDSITFSKGFWAGVPGAHGNLSADDAKRFELVDRYMLKACWADWKGPKFGNAGGMQVPWAEQNVGRWLTELNPEVALVMFGTNDLREGRSVEDYARRTRAVVQKCLDNGTVVILSTPPPRTKKLAESKQYADAVRQIGADLKVPVEDFLDAVLTRRPDDWDGSQEQFKDPNTKDGYDVPTLISRDGVHPSAPKQYAGDFSDEALKHHGYNLRTVLALRDYAGVIQSVLTPPK